MNGVCRVGRSGVKVCEPNRHRVLQWLRSLRCRHRDEGGSYCDLGNISVSLARRIHEEWGKGVRTWT